jgi:hypothetical protein
MFCTIFNGIRRAEAELNDMTTSIFFPKPFSITNEELQNASSIIEHAIRNDKEQRYSK